MFELTLHGQQCLSVKACFHSVGHNMIYAESSITISFVSQSGMIKSILTVLADVENLARAMTFKSRIT